MNKRGSNETVWPRVIKIILLVLVIIGVVIVVYRFGLVQKFKNLFPDYFPQNLSEAELRGLGCDKVVAQIGLSGAYGFRKQYLFMDGVNTNLLWDYENGKVIAGSIVVADIEKGVVKVKPYFLDENSEEYLKNRWDGSQGDILVNVNGFKSLDNSFKLENQNYLCKTDGQAEDFIEAKSCIESCSIFNGECKASANTGEVSYGKLDCSSGECFVKENEDKQLDGDLKIDTFTLVGNPGENDINLLNTNGVSLENGVLRFINIKASNSDSFCYIISTDKETLFKSYNNKFDKMSVYVSQFNPSLEKSLQFIAWNSSNKAIKRIKVNIDNTENKDGTLIIDDSELKSKIEKAPIGSIFYVHTESIWFQSDISYRVNNLRLTKNREDSILVEAAISPDSRTTYGKVANYQFKQLNCNSWTTNSNLYFSKINSEQNGLREAILKYCKLDKFWGLFG